ncbi:MAG: hypothetical protein DRG30_08490, partial [Epsilonproteobacteria bacterium]
MKNLFLLLLVSVSLLLHGSDFDQNCKLAGSNDASKLKPLLIDIQMLNVTDANGKTLLLCAVETGAYKSASLLLEKGIDPNAKDDENRTALQHILEWRRGDHFNDVKTVLVLLEHNANVNHKDKYGNTLLMQASNPEMIRLLLSYGADMDHSDNKGDKILFRFAKGSYNQKAEIINVLVEFGADLTEKDKKGKRAFDYMTPNDQYALYVILDDNIEIDEKKITNWLRDAIKDRNYKLIERLLKMGDYANTKDSYTKKPFIFDVIDDALIIGLFLDHGLDVNSTYGYRRKSLLQEAIGKCAVESVRLLLKQYEKIQDNYKTLASLLRCDDSNKSVELADMLLNKGVSVSAVDNKGHTLLHLAAREGRGELCRFFVEHGVDVNLKDKEGVSPLLYALAADNDSCTQVLLKSKVDIHTKDPKGVGALQAAISQNHIEIVRQLLEKGLNPNEADKVGHTALMLAAQKGNLNIMKLLFEKGASITMVDADGASALHHACRYNGSVDVVQFLLDQNLDINIETKKGQTPLWVSAEFDNLPIAKYLIEYGANINVQDAEGNSPLHRAAKRGHKKIIVLLLLKGTNKELKNKEGLDALELAVKKHSYSKDAYQKIFSGQYDDSLLDKKHIFSFKNLNDILLYAVNGGDLHMKNENDDSLLHIAAGEYGNEIVKYLLSVGLNPNNKNKDGRTPLHLATQHHRALNVHSLLQKDANLLIKDKEGKTSVDLAVADIGNNKKNLLIILREMLRHGLKIIPALNAKGEPILNDAVENLELLSLLIEKGLDVNAMGRNGNTPLIMCAVHNYEKSAKVLLDAGANKDIQNKRGRTALYTSTVLKSYETAEILLANGAHGNLKTKNGNSPLINALLENDYEMVSLLLKYSIDPNISNKQKDTVLHLAVMNANEMMVKLLLEKKADSNLMDDIGMKPLDYAKKLKLKKIISMLEPVTKAKDDVPSHNVVIKEEKKSENNILSVKAEDKNVAKYEQSKLHQAVSVKNLDAVKHLLENHTEIDIVDKLGRTPLHYAAIRGYIEIAELLLDRGANINAV